MLASAFEDNEQRLVREFFETFGRGAGFFVDVGANHPHDGSQTYHLEFRGWQGVLVEPVPELADALRQSRNAKVFAVACSAPENAGRSLPFHVDGPLSSLNRDRMAPWAAPQQTIEVPIRTLDDILTEALAPTPLDFLSIDVEGHEIEVLQGFNFALWNPRLIVIEDHVGNLRRHNFLKSKGYRLVRRVGLNGWYVPASSPIRFGIKERIRLLRKYYFGLPLRKLRNRLTTHHHAPA